MSLRGGSRCGTWAILCPHPWASVPIRRKLKVRLFPCPRNNTTEIEAFPWTGGVLPKISSGFLDHELDLYFRPSGRKVPFAWSESNPETFDSLIESFQCREAVLHLRFATNRFIVKPPTPCSDPRSGCLFADAETAKSIQLPLPAKTDYYQRKQEIVAYYSRKSFGHCLGLRDFPGTTCWGLALPSAPTISSLQWLPREARTVDYTDGPCLGRNLVTFRSSIDHGKVRSNNGAFTRWISPPPGLGGISRKRLFCGVIAPVQEIRSTSIRKLNFGGTKSVQALSRGAFKRCKGSKYFLGIAKWNCWVSGSSISRPLLPDSLVERVVEFFTRRRIMRI